jgi:hypothetical protein
MRGMLGVVLVVGGLAAACSNSSSSGTGGNGSVMGTVSGHGLTVKDSVGLVETDARSGATQLTIALTDLAGTCAFVEANPTANPKNTGVVSMNVLFASGGVAPGTYQVGGTAPSADAGVSATPTVTASFLMLDGMCVASEAFATGGSMTLSTVSGGIYSGTFSLSFGGDMLSGSFNAASCAFPDAGTQAGDGGPACL